MAKSFYCYRCKYKCEARVARPRKCPNRACQRTDWDQKKPAYEVRNGGEPNGKKS